MKNFLISIIVCLLISMAGQCSAQTQVPQVKAFGHCTTQIQPDGAVLTLKITGKGHCAKVAEQLCQKYLDNALNVLNDFSIGKDATSQDGLYTALDGTVSVVLEVRVIVFSKLPGLIQSFASRAGCKVEHLAWFHEHIDQLEAHVLSKAAKDARQKAQAACQVLGSRPGEAILVNIIDKEDKPVSAEQPCIRIEKKVEVVFRLVPI